MTEIKAATNCDIIRYIFVDLHCCQNFLLKTDRKPGVNGLSGAGVFRAYCAAVIFSGYNICGNRCIAGNIAVLLQQYRYFFLNRCINHLLIEWLIIQLLRLLILTCFNTEEHSDHYQADPEHEPAEGRADFYSEVVSGNFCFSVLCRQL